MDEDDFMERNVEDDLSSRYSTIPELMLLLKQLRLNDPTVKRVCIQSKNLPTAYLNTLFSLLSTNTNVTHVNLSHCHVTDEVVDALTLFIRSNLTAIELDLSRNYLSDLSVGDISSALILQASTTRQSLRKLVLQGNYFSDRGIGDLCGAISKTNIQVLKIGKMVLGVLGAHGIANMLMQPTCPVRKLDLRSSNLGSSGTAIVSKALASNKSLETLCLGKNNIDDNAVHDLVEALRGNETLRVLDVQYNPITNVGAVKFVQCFDDSNYSLRKLKLRHCDAITDDVKEMLLDILVMNTFGPELACKTKDALRCVQQEESSMSYSSDNNQEETSMSSSSDNNISLIRQHQHDGSSSFQQTFLQDDKPYAIQQVPPAQSSIQGNENCVICFESPAECVLLPCKHRNCCSNCAKRMRTCHMCREQIVKVFLPTIA